MFIPRLSLLRKRNILLLGAVVVPHLFDCHNAQSQNIKPKSSLGYRKDSSRYTSSPGSEYDVCIVGGGVVGLAIAMTLAATRKELRIVLLEKEDSVAAGASSGE